MKEKVSFQKSGKKYQPHDIAHVSLILDLPKIGDSWKDPDKTFKMGPIWHF